MSLNRFGSPTIETRIGEKPGRELRQLLGDATLTEAIECVVGGGVDGFVALCGGPQRFVSEADDAIIEYVRELMRLGRLIESAVLARIEKGIDDKLNQLVKR